MALSGVRSSWLILARNCDLCWLASASCRLLSWVSSKQTRVLDLDHWLVGGRRGPSPHGDNLRQDRDSYLIRRDRAKIETCGRLEIAQTFRGNAPLRKSCF